MDIISGSYSLLTFGGFLCYSKQFTIIIIPIHTVGSLNQVHTCATQYFCGFVHKQARHVPS